MVSFRKILWVFALMVTCVAIASAQYPTFNCTANAGVPPVDRQEGLAEEVGQVVIICTGGTPTKIGQLIPTVNVQVFLNVNITSKILADPWTEALLLIDEPAPANQLVCGAATSGFDVNQGTCPIAAPSNIGLGGMNQYGPGNSSLPGSYDGAAGHPNIWQARCSPAPTCAASQQNTVVWLGVPIDPPGTTTQRTIRLVNIRANANGVLPSGTLLPSTIYMLISVSGTGALPLTTQNLTVAVVQTGMAFSVVGNPSFLQCQPQNQGTICPSFRLRYQENFGTAFRRQNTNGAPHSEFTTTDVVPQNSPGTIYNTEGMFYGTNLPDLTGLGTGSRGNLGTSAGKASQGTRLIARFQGVPSNVSIWVTVENVNRDLVTPTNLSRLTTTNTDGSGAYTPPSSSGTSTGSCTGSTSVNPPVVYTNQALVQVSLNSSGNGQVVWEVLDADTAQITSMDFGVVVQYGSSPLPSLGSATVTGNYAPLSTVNTFSASAPVPRFVDNPQSATTFTINPCRTNLLFPFITNQAGYDTGLSIANTSASPFEAVAPRQTGKCTFYYFGAFSGDPTRSTFQQTTTSNVDAGTLAIGTLSGGGDHGIIAVAGFQGYAIVRCDFQYAHGFAYVSVAGAPLMGSATGYVALVMDNGFSNQRTNNTSEVLGN